MISFNQKLLNQCKAKNNRLCIGLDFDINKLQTQTTTYMKGFIKDVIDSTVDLCPIYKINFAFYEQLGFQGYEILNSITEHINGRAISIADAKRGDIGNSSAYYAKAVFETLNYDSITVSPYMGEDSILPFCNYKEKGVFILCLTSNKGSENFQTKDLSDSSSKLYVEVAKFASNLNINDNIGLVVGATKNSKMEELRKYSKKIPWLIPGVGFQGGSLEDSVRIGSLYNSLPIINVSRGIISYGNGTVDDISLACKNYTKKIRNIL